MTGRSDAPSAAADAQAAGPGSQNPDTTLPLPTPEYLATRLAELIRRGNIPGASVAVRAGTETVTATAGVLGLATGYPVTADSVFQIGSITKVWTATLVMQLVDEGVIDLDAPVRTYLPEFRTVDEAASKAVTIRQLLTHTSGIEGDIFDDHGFGDDAVATYVAGLAETAPQIFPPGERFSYCNSGIVVLGRVVEVLTGQTWEATLRERLVVPLGLAHVANDANEAILQHAAIGHMPGPDGTLVTVPTWQMPRSNSPAGSNLAMSATNLLEFAAAHVNLGLLPDGTRLLSESSALAMRVPHVDVPGPEPIGSAWGLGWNLYDWAGGPVVGHDGGTLGQSAMLRVVPSRGVSIAILTNGGNLLVMYDLVRELFAGLADVRVPELPTPPAEPATVDPRYFVGRYASRSSALDVTETEDGLNVSMRLLGSMAALAGGDRASVTKVVAADARTLVATEQQDGRHAVYSFVGDGDRAEFLYQGRAVRRVSAGEAEQDVADRSEEGHE
ncbi:serine hydrolase domain-containing protein [Streptomyces sp. SID3343]|uniref:serine hydrolase domain-containing protein n=1 Tax=Streptomyces sp. SID3343 TaxID=2690260 RepID=UPI00136D4DA4|nr:serine hydrolase domain-containing protein [Streptomyces sp. SID3343]MYW05880.1 serine hydrolase [Streptomyces sp. SID3343]